jgi:hypothetical protein
MPTEADSIKLVYDYQFLQIVRHRLNSSSQWIVRWLDFEEPSRVVSQETFESLSEALSSVRDQVQAEERYATAVEIPDLSEATKARLDGELPRLFCVDPSKL